MAILAYNLQMIVFTAIFAIYLNIIVLTTSAESRARDINNFILFFIVAPAAFFYFYFVNWSVISLIFEDSKLPAAKESSSILWIIYIIFAFFALINFIVLTALLLILMIALVYMGMKAY